MNDPTRAGEILRHGAYVCLQFRNSQRAAALAIEELAERAHFRNEYSPSDSDRSFAFIRRVKATPAQMLDPDLVASDALIHLSSPRADEADHFCLELERALEGVAIVRTRRGVQRAPVYSSAALKEFAYAHQVQQRPGNEMPNVFFLPLSKTAAWWAKDWMERHTFFHPHYENGAKQNDGHALSAAAGIPHLYRRTYKHVTLPAPAGEYEFLNYFECAATGISVFHEVCSALRDIKRNPEWQFVQEGPLWQGRRVDTWRELFQ